MTTSVSSYVYLHRIYRHELGFRGSSLGAGAFYYISKTAAARFFPPLRRHVLNDYLLLKVKLPSGRYVYLRYVYHNDKILGSGTRDEYRIYISGLMSEDPAFTSPDTILLFSRVLHATLRGPEEIIHLHAFKPRAGDRAYQHLNSIMGNENHCNVQLADLGPATPTLEYDTQERPVIPPDVVREAASESPWATDEITREESTRLVRATSFRDLVLNAYGYNCAATGLSMSYGSLTNLEACHIIPVSMRGNDSIGNGISLGKDLHWAFDKGFFTIGSDFKLKVHDKLTDAGILFKLNGTGINLPADSGSRPNSEALEWHSQNIFGSFLQN